MKMKHFRNWKTKLTAAISAGVLAVTGTAASLSAMSVSAEGLDLDNYAKLLQYSLYFYDANMCGSAAENSAFSWRSACHTGDAVEGGFHDAGDAIKCGLTAGFTASTLGWMCYEYQDQFVKTGTMEHYQLIMNEFCDFFKASTTLSGGEVSSFVYEMGDDGKDHSTWYAPEKMWDRDSSETYSVTNGASNVAAQYAAALAQNYIISGREEDLTYATALYNFAAKYRKMTYEQSTYSDKDVQDDISWAAGWMYLATKQDDYLTENSKYTSSTNDWTKDYCYANASLGAAIINAEITGNWSYATSCIDSVVNANQNQYYVMNSWGSARHNTLMQTCALVVSHHKDESGKDYSEWAKKQMNYILGDNNANVCLVVGWNDVSATSPHHRAASNLTNSSDWHEYNSWNGDYASTGGHILYGALCGGPTSTDFNTYDKSAKEATSNEVALDYQVGLVGAAAGLYAAYGTGSVVAEIGPEVTVYPSEVAVANGETPVPGTTVTTVQTTETTTETTTTATTTDAVQEVVWGEVPDEMTVGEEAKATIIHYLGLSGVSCTWTSSDPEILEVTETGKEGDFYTYAKISAKKAGKVTLTANDNGQIFTHEITVTPNTVDPKADWEKVPDSMTAGETTEASISYSIIGNSFQWTSSDPEILSVEGNGYSATLTAKKPGTITLTATNGVETLEKEITVKPAETTVTTETEAPVTDTTTTETTVITNDTTSSQTAVAPDSNALYGDINMDGSITLSDAVMLNKKVADTVSLSDAALRNADCNLDGEVNGSDAIILMKFLTRILSSLPNTEA
ncbi:glycoside hydrolase family 9 protein [Ruminococcus sp.]|uniref:glycoside hydrolase family 9 protein n=2 Tax=Ruminococcus sp. TaxID=41978 RepID=UPI00260B5741|nr:glycoside hydrolase family 9 protein [Ruminococcus sp.]MEE0023206.1 glycoside hydrolase family 9 protein [Ruminococcus sp.]